MIAQCKGKDIDKVPKSRLLKSGWYPAIKYDGNFIQIEKIKDTIRFWTSGGKQFYIEYLAEELIRLNQNVDFLLELEYIANTDGKLGDRGKCTTTTYRTNFEKKLASGAIKGRNKFKLFDVYSYKNETNGVTIDAKEVPFKIRRNILKIINLPEEITLAGSYGKSFDLDSIKVSSFLDEGYEGLYLKHESHLYVPGKRVNTAIKIKAKPTADLRCIGFNEGENDFTGMIGSLICIDSKGRKVNVSSGLQIYERNNNLRSKYLGAIIEIGYEQIMDTYVQPKFICVREDKTKED